MLLDAYAHVLPGIQCEGTAALDRMRDYRSPVVCFIRP